MTVLSTHSIQKETAEALNVVLVSSPQIILGPKMTVEDDQFRLPFVLDVRPASEFHYDAAKIKLASLRLQQNEGPRVTFVIPGDVVAGEGFGEEDGAGRQEQLLRLAGWIDIESRLTVSHRINDASTTSNPCIQVGCAGALLSYLQRGRANAYLPGDEAAHRMFRISTIEMFTLRDTM